MLALRLPPEIEQRLDALAKKPAGARAITRARRSYVKARILRIITWPGGVLHAADRA